MDDTGDNSGRACFLDRTQASGCQVVVVIPDTSGRGWRPRDLDLGSLPFLRGQACATVVDVGADDLQERRADG